MFFAAKICTKRCGLRITNTGTFESRALTARGAEVQVVLSANAHRFVAPTALQAVSGRPVRQDLWDEDAEAAMGHIELAAPVAHIWFMKSLPSRIATLLDMTIKNLEKVLYFEQFIVVEPGLTDLKKGDIISEDQYINYQDEYGEDSFSASIGAEAIEQMLQNIDLETEREQLKQELINTKSELKKTKIIKRLKLVENFLSSKNKPEWMILKVLPVIPPELRPLVPLDGGRFATSDLNDLYRRVIIRNNRLKRLVEIKAPEVILRNEKRMLQESVDSLFDNTRKSSAVKTESNRPLKSLSDSLKGKQGRFRQNLLGKRVDYSARSVIVVGPELKLYECGLPKDMAAELYKPFIIRKLIERGIVKTVKSAKKIIDRREPIVWDILENVLKGHPVLLNRAPTLHRLGIQAFQPKLIEGKAIQLHPLTCTAFNADFDGDQMAVHLPLGPEAILEAQLLMLGSHNILNPANGSPITVPSQDMVLGLYYMTKSRKSDENKKLIGEGLTFYSSEEVKMAYNENKVDLNAHIKCRILRYDSKTGKSISEIIETTPGRIFFNEVVPEKAGFFNEVLTKKNLREIIGKILQFTSVPETSEFLDLIKNLGYSFAFKGGLSFSLGDIIIPNKKQTLIDNANSQVDGIINNYNMGLITNNERYNQVIDVWTSANATLTELAMKQISEDQQGFNSVYMMLDSGARGSKEQIRQLTGMRGLMAKPKKSNIGGGEIIENPILSNFKEGLSILEYFISTHGARKGLADTALKTADAGYLTRRLVDVSQDVIVNEFDCGTLRGLEVSALKKNEEIVETLGERILGRVSLNQVVDPTNNEVLVEVGTQINEEIVNKIESTPITSIEVRSPLTCETKRGICVNCYGRNLSTGKLVQIGEAVGVVAAQSIGEPGTQLTLRTFHVGGVAGNISEENSLISKFEGVAEIDDLKVVKVKDNDGNNNIVISRTSEIRIIDKNTKNVLSTNNIPYGSYISIKNGQKIKKGDLICQWDPFNGVIVSEFSGKIVYENIEIGKTYKVEIDEQTGFKEKVITDSRDKKLIPTLLIQDSKGVTLRSYNLPVGAHIMVDEKEKITKGKILVKIPRKSGKSGDITGGLPRVTELFEARNPSNPAIVSEIDGVVSFGKIKRGNREIVVESKFGDVKKYLVKLSNQILVQENDFIKAGMPLSDGSITPTDILNIKGPAAVQQYLVNEVQEVYRLQGVKINDKHFEVVVRQMMRKVKIIDPGDSIFLENQLTYKDEFISQNDSLYGMKVVEESGDSETFKVGKLVSTRQLRDENSILQRDDKKLVSARDAKPATASTQLQGITRASLQTKSFISAASFQETTKVLNEAAVNGKNDSLEGLKENVIVGHKIPAGTGNRKHDNILVGLKEEYNSLLINKEEEELNY